MMMTAIAVVLVVVVVEMMMIIMIVVVGMAMIMMMMMTVPIKFTVGGTKTERRDVNPLKASLIILFTLLSMTIVAILAHPLNAPEGMTSIERLISV